MPRSVWKGAVSFGLVTIPVKVYGATEEKDIGFRQVHAADAGRIRYKRVCEVCGEEVPFAEIRKGYEAADGRLAVLEPDDFAGLPAAEGRTVDVVQFVDVDSVDPTYFDRTYFLEAEKVGTKPYVLLREALAETGKAAVVKVALRSRETLALIRPDGDVLRMHTMLWPDELRDGSFAAPADDVQVSDAEVGMARMFIDQLSGGFRPGELHRRLPLGPGEGDRGQAGGCRGSRGRDRGSRGQPGGRPGGRVAGLGGGREGPSCAGRSQLTHPPPGGGRVASRGCDHLCAPSGQRAGPRLRPG